MAEIDISGGVVEPSKIDLTGGIVPRGTIGTSVPRIQFRNPPVRLPGGLSPEMLSPRPGVPSQVGRQAQEQIATTPLIPQRWEAAAEQAAQGVSQKEHPYGSVLADIGVVGARMGTGFSTPQNLALMSGMMALGPLRAVRTLMEAGFTYQQARDAYRDWTEGLAMYRAGNVREGRIRMMSAPIEAGLALLSGKGAFKETRGIISDLHPAPTTTPTWAAQVADPATGIAREMGFLGPGSSPEQVVSAIEKYYALLASSAQRIMNARELGKEVENGDTMLLNIRRAAAELKREGVDIHKLADHPVFQRHGEHVRDTLQTIAEYAADQQVRAGKKGLAGMYGEVTAPTRPTIPEGPAPPNPSPEARARDAAVDEEHAQLLARRASHENELKRLQALTQTKAFQRRTGRSQAVVLGRIDFLERQLARIKAAEDDLSGQMRMSVFGLDMAAKWAKRRYDVEIKPLLQEWKVTLPEALKAIGHGIAPRLGADPRILNSLGRMMGRREFHKTSLNLMLTKIREMFDTIPQHEQIAFVDRYKNNQRQPYSEFDHIVDFLKDVDENTYRTLAESIAASIDDPHFQALWAAMPEHLKRDLLHQVSNLKVNPNYQVPKELETFVQKVLSWKKDHYEVVWKNKPQNDKELDALGPIVGNIPLGRPLRRGGLGGRRPLGPRGYFQRSTLDTMSEGIDRGGIPVTYNPIRMFELAQSYRWRTITAMDMWNDAKNIGARKFVRLGQEPPAGWMKINDRMGEVWRMVDQTGGVQKTGDWYMHPDYARMLNNFLSRDIIRENIVGRGVFWAKNQWTAYRLGWSVYHASTETALAFGTKLGQAAQQLTMAARYKDGQLFRSGMRDLGRVMAAPYEYARTGGSVIRYITDKQAFLNTMRGHEFAARFPDFDHMLDLMFNSGVKLALHEDEKLKSIQTFKQLWADDKQIQAMFSTPWMANQVMMGPLFENFIPKLKLGAFASQLAINLRDRQADIDAGVLTEGEVGRRTWNMIEDLFGQVNWDKFFWNNSFKTGMQILFRAPQFSAGYGRFTAGTLRQLQSLGESAGYFYNKLGLPGHVDVPPSTTYMPRLDPNFAIFAGLATTWAVLNGVATFVMTGQRPTEVLDLIAAKSGKKDTNGRDLRVLSPGLWKDGISLAFRGFHSYFQSKFSDPIGALLDIWDNKDFQGNLVYNPFDPFMKQQLQKVEHAIGLPIGASIFRREQQMGAGATKATILGELGFSPAPPNLSYSPAENSAYELLKRRVGGKTPEEMERLVSYMERKQEGQLTPYERMEAIKNARKPYLERLWLRADQYGATYDDLKYIYDRATPDERKMLKPLLIKKYQKTLRRGERAVLPQ